MISGGGRYWLKAGNGAQNASSANPAANRRAFALAGGFRVCDPLARLRVLPTRQCAREIRSGAALINSPVRCASHRQSRALYRSPTIPRIAPERSPIISAAESGISKRRAKSDEDNWARVGSPLGAGGAVPIGHRMTPVLPDGYETSKESPLLLVIDALQFSRRTGSTPKRNLP